jgi:hypothetical protein
MAIHDNIFDNFSEEALEALDFARCQRADGSYYGTSGQCRKGKEAGDRPAEAPKGDRAPVLKDRIAKAKASGDKKKPEIDESKLYRLNQKQNQLAERIGRERSMLARMSTGKAAAELRKRREDRIKKLSRSLKRLGELRTEANRRLDKGARKSGRPRPLMAPNWGTSPGRPTK